MEVISLNDDALKKIPNIIKYVYEIFGEKEVLSIYVVLDEGNISFLVKNDKYNVFIDGSCNAILFTTDQDSNIMRIYIKPYTICFDDGMYLIDDKGIQHFLSFTENDEPDYEGYTGTVFYNQYDPNNDVMCELRYQQMYRNIDGRTPVYSFHTKEISEVYIDEKYEESKKRHIGIIPKQSKYYFKSTFSSDELGYNLVAINEYGMYKFLKEGAYNLIRENKVVRYFKCSIEDLQNNYYSIWPLTRQYTRDDINKIIEGYGFNTSIPDILLNVFNGDELIISELQALMKEIKKIQEHPEIPQNVDKCLTLKINLDDN